MNSSVHSYLILSFGSAERITRDVGFYDIANTAGQLIVKLLSGLNFQLGGLLLCPATTGAMGLAILLAVQRFRTVCMRKINSFFRFKFDQNSIILIIS